MDGKIDSGNDHEKGSNHLQRRVVKPGKAGVMGRHSTYGNSAECVADRIKKSHTAQPVSQCAHDGDAQDISTTTPWRFR